MTIQRIRNPRIMKKLTGGVILVGISGDASDLRYATGYSAVDPAIYVQCGKRKWLIVPVMEKGRAEREVYEDVEVLTPSDLPLGKQQRRRLGFWIVGVARKEKLRRLTVSAWCPVGIVDRLRRSGFRVSVSQKPLFPDRAIKTPREINAIGYSQKAAGHAFGMAMKQLQRARISQDRYLYSKGRKLTAEDVRRTIDCALLERGCVGSGTIVACGSLGADPHERGSGALRADQPMVFDIFPQHRKSGYWGDLSRTVVRGKANKKTKKMYRAVKAAHAAALREVRHGVSVRRIYETAVRVLEEAGFETCMNHGRPEGFIHSAGHGVGLDIHEAPGIGPVDGRLCAGQVITIEPGLYYADPGGMRIEDTVVVTRTGYRLLCRVPMKLELG